MKPVLSESASLLMSLVTEPLTVRSASAMTVAPFSIVIVLLLLAVAYASAAASDTNPTPSLLATALTLSRPWVSMITSRPVRLAPSKIVIDVVLVAVAIASGLPTSMKPPL